MPPEPTPQPAPAAQPALQVVPQPLPTQVKAELNTISAPGQPTRHMVRMDFTTPAGTSVFFLDRAAVQQIVQGLAAQLQGWPAELVVPQVNLEEVRRAVQAGGSNGTRGSRR